MYKWVILFILIYSNSFGKNAQIKTGGIFAIENSSSYNVSTNLTDNSFQPAFGFFFEMNFDIFKVQENTCFRVLISGAHIRFYENDSQFMIREIPITFGLRALYIPESIGLMGFYIESGVEFVFQSIYINDERVYGRDNVYFGMIPGFGFEFYLNDTFLLDLNFRYRGVALNHFVMGLSFGLYL